ncbi:UDP-3-O-(3-hydroxymyristoyl)glucosamine N-acyltransferase [Pararhodobacter sp.]|uniref:UDP-3-O-(3-hydroxymyristoyl)glucosamine N-acyltransferase n=1 Tax=Pararhodobacter sp. TaxID=2127056 RepID=UPI002AFE245D|nr:UDP-3-O-(3-hydroxymyristoyl)glucosamine N-acyltransferase [Pararhodobacter sp.]
MAHRVSDIAAALGARFAGQGEVMVIGAAEPALATSDHLAMAMDPKYARGLAEGQARVAVLWEGADWQALGLEAAIFAPRPRLAMSGLTRLFDPGPGLAAGIHPSAVIDATAQIGAGASIGAFVVIGPGVRIGARARIDSHVSIARNARIGEDALLLAGVRICTEVTIGDRFVAMPNVVIGGDGFSFVTAEKSHVENVRETLGDAGDAPPQAWLRIHSLASVTIGDDVEIGANSTVDKGTVRDTRIGRGTKIDNLVQVGHNVIVGEDCLLCAQAGVAGSTRVGNRVVLGGKVGVADNLFVGDDVVAGGGSVITSNVPAGRVMLGYPAVQMTTSIEMYKASRRLPRLIEKFAALESAVKVLIDKDRGAGS